MNNTTKTENWTFIKQHSVIERAPESLIGIILLCCIWIVVVNILVFLLLLFNRKSLKHFVTLQLLCLSMTDFLVGATAIPVAMTYYITSAFPSAKTCAGIMFGYIVAQLASLFHVFAICLHRFVTIKYKISSSHNSGEGMVKRILYHILVVWIYICLCRYLTKKWNRINMSKQSPVSTIHGDKSKVTNIGDDHIRTNENTNSPIEVEIASLQHDNRTMRIEGNINCVPNRTQKDKINITNLFQVKTETENKNATAKDPSTAVEANNVNDLSSEFHRQKIEPKCPISPEQRKERDVLCTIGIVLVLMNICITPLNMTLLFDTILDGSLSRKVKFTSMVWALVNSGLNPVVYALKIKAFRDVVRRCMDRCVAMCKS